MDILDHIATILKSFDIEPKPLDQIVDSYLRRHREIGSRARRLVADAAFGVMRWRGRIDGWLAMSGRGAVDHRNRVVCYIAWKRPEEARAAGMETPALVGMAARALGGEMPRQFPGGEAAFHSFPDFLWRLLVREYGKVGAASLAASLNEEARPVLCVNTLRATRDEVMRALSAEGIRSEPTALSPHGLILDCRVDLGQLDSYRRGLFEPQDESSQLAAIIADPKAGETVLDACAGAGGKSLAMAMLMRGQGRIIAADPRASKLRELRRRADRNGVKIINVISTKSLLSRRNIKGKCDLLFIDAPCSGTGTLRRNPDLKWRLNPDTISVRIELQRNLLREYADWVRPGGRLVYATCSILREENEDIVALLADGGGFRKIDVREILLRHGINADGIASGEGYLKIDPRSGSRDGFFAAVLVRAPTVCS